MAIRYKLGLIVGGFSLIILFMFAVTWKTSSAQKDDSLVVNLAGRQRMLFQKMTKEVFMFASLKGSKQSDTYGKDAKNTIKVFDLTLKSLCDSGDAPLGVNLEKTAYSRCPATEEPAGAQLQVVQGLWKPFIGHMNLILTGQDSPGKSMEYVLENNLKLMGPWTVQLP